MIENEVAFEVDHESVDEPPDWMDDGEAESEQVGTMTGGMTGGIIGGGGGGGGGVGGITQHGGASCANTCAGVTNPVANASPIPKATVATSVKNPTKSGLYFL